MPRSDGYKNLTPNSERTREELRSMTRNGGIASGKKRREQKEFKELYKLVCGWQLPSSMKAVAEEMEQAGIKQKDQSFKLAIVLAQMKLAASGTQNSTKAAELVTKMIGEMPADKLETVNQNYNLPTGITITYVDSDEPEHTDSASV